MKKFTDLIEIKNIGNQLIFTGVNDQLTKSIIVGESDGNLEVEERPDEDMIIQGYFNLKRLCMLLSVRIFQIRYVFIYVTISQ